MSKQRLEQAMEQGQGILRLAPNWVPRSFCRPGNRIKLHPDDTYCLGLERGGIDERWLASTTPADNGPGTPEDEGLSCVVIDTAGKDSLLLRDAISELKSDLIGDSLWQAYRRWPMFSKFFDNAGPLPHHIHHRDDQAVRVGQSGKPEMYFFPAQMNNHGGEFPFTFFGLNPEVGKEQVRAALSAFPRGDNRILDLSRAYKLVLDTGWDVPPGVLHAPGSLCTYEPQFASDVYAMYQSVLYGGQCVPEDLLWKNCPPEEVGNIDYLIDRMDWDENVDPDFYRKHFMKPIPARPAAEMADQGYLEEWICYRCPLVSAKRLTVYPGQYAVIKDRAAYGLICIQGQGSIGPHPLASPTLIRYGALTDDEYFVSETAAKGGVNIRNTSRSEDLVILKHFAQNPDRPD